jgi:2-dehydropantoate 2-reductase
MVNAALNPLAATLGCQNGYLANTVSGPSLLTAVCHELYTQFKDELTDIAKSETELIQQVLAVASKTALNRNSMEVDVSFGRQTEIDYIVGYLLRKAPTGSMPVLSFLKNLVEAKAEIVRQQEHINVHGSN